MTLQTSSATSMGNPFPVTPDYFDTKLVPIYADLRNLTSGTVRWVSVKDAAFGATGDGTTDDTVAIKAALGSMTAGGVLFFPRGTYLLSGGLTVPADNVTLLGEGPSSMLTGVFVAIVDAKIFASNKQNVRVQDLMIGGAHSFGVFITGGAGHYVGRNVIQGGKIPLSGTCGGIFLQNVDQVTVEQNRLSLNGDGDNSTQNSADILCNTGTYNITNSVIRENYCSSTSVVMNLAIYDPLRVQVLNNRCTGAFTPSLNSYIRQGYGIMLYKTSSMTSALVGECEIDGNVVYNVQGTGIYNQGIRDTVITRNIVHDVCSVQTDGSLSVAGIAVDDVSDNVLCAHNRISRSSVDGIQVTGPSPGAQTGTQILGNNIEVCWGRGIGIRSFVDDCLIANNVISLTSKDGIASYSVTTQRRIQVLNNSIRSIAQDNVARGLTSCASAVSWVVAGNVFTAINNRAWQDQGVGNTFWGNLQEGFPVIPFSSESALGLSSSEASVLQLSYGAFGVQGFRSALTTVTANYTATKADQTISVNSSSTVTVTLPTASTVTGQIFDIQRMGTQTVVIVSASTSSINGSATTALATQYQSLTVQSFGSGYLVK